MSQKAKLPHHLLKAYLDVEYAGIIGGPLDPITKAVEAGLKEFVRFRKSDKDIDRAARVAEAEEILEDIKGHCRKMEVSLYHLQQWKQAQSWGKSPNQ